ncbi:MAG: diguanylate cyclase [Campylobacterota bacterium]|nr:diguanylate cyclase [Campylobacterota bacterium]
MQYKLQSFKSETLEFFKQKQEFISEEFMDKNLIAKSNLYEDIANIKHIYQTIIKYFCKGENEELLNNHIELTKLYIDLEVPYIALLNELNHMQHILMDLLIDYDMKGEIINIYKLYTVIQNIVAKEYFNIYTKKLISICNIRLSSLSDMVEKFSVDHYADHLKWLIELSISLENLSIKNFPETDKTICSFGKWLNSDAKYIIKNNSKLNELEKIHSQLHYISTQIKQILLDNDKDYDYDILLTYLEKCELMSMSMGTELALIDNTIINQKAIKDSLTGALGRQVLSSIFQNQYELSLATNTKFVIALCDLDFFKKVNDTYGHIAGDKMLQSFIKIVKNNVRNSDVIIRYGGEEFVLILPAIDMKHAVLVFEKIRKEFEEFTLLLDGNKIKTTVSIGTFEIEAKEKYSSELLDEYIDYADKKLYKAKNNGRNRIE